MTKNERRKMEVQEKRKEDNYSEVGAGDQSRRIADKDTQK